MNTVLKTNLWMGVALFATSLLLVVMSALHLPSMWGLNHLVFLPLPWAIGLAVSFGILAVLFTLPRQTVKLDAASDALDRLLFHSGVWPRALLAALSVVIFWLFRAETHFLGDGYLNLSILGKGEDYLLKWTEPGAILAVRALQSIVGAYTPESALMAFRILSILSGGMVLFNLLDISRYISDHREIRFLALTSLLFSGTLLLWFGYVEHYPVFWAAATTFLALAVRAIRTNGNPLAAILLFLLAVFTHLQAAWMIPAVLYLILRRSLSTSHVRLLAALTVLGALLFVVLSSRSMSLATLFLPFFTGRPASPDYAVLSGRHLLDLLNLIVLISPGILGLAALSWRTRPGSQTPITSFLALLTVGGLLFATLVDPSLGMARDWDLFSFCILPLPLWIIARADGARPKACRFVALYSLTCLFLSVSFVAANLSVKSSEARFESTLEHTGSKNRSGWGVAVKYYQDKRDIESAQGIANRMEHYFPEEGQLREAYAALKGRDYRRAFNLARRLVIVDSLRSDYLQILGNVYGKLGAFDSAAVYYDKAVTLRPHNPTLKNEFGQLYLTYRHYPEALAMLRSARNDDPKLDFIMEGIGLTFARMNQDDSATMIADSLFLADPHSPGGHLLALTVALLRGDSTAASHHLREFQTNGKARSDYQALAEYFEELGL